jgi:hypothetical protein
MMMNEMLIRNSDATDAKQRLGKPTQEKYGAKETGCDPVILSPRQFKEADDASIHYLIS